jgi:hypothetical protein
MVVVSVVVVATLVAAVMFLLKRPAKPAKPPVAQPVGCPDVMVVSIPGTWESSAQLDPLNPTEFPNALLLNVTRPLTEQFQGGRIQVYTVPYTAQFHNPLNNDGQMSYDESRKEGTDKTRQAIVDMATKCPLTSYVIVGFSQGAVIGGDIASDIGHGRGPVDEKLVLGVALIADGRRQPGKGQDVPPTPPGEGAEVLLKNMPFLSGFGLTMTGARDGFGPLNERIYEICADGDLICAAPQDAFNPLNAVGSLRQIAGAGDPVHAMYNTTDYWNSNGQSATVWMRTWAANIIDKAPHPTHK